MDTFNPANPPVRIWQRQLESHTETIVTATRDQVQIAVRLLAAGARELCPEATRIQLSESDQGPWLGVDGLTDADEAPIELECGDKFQDDYSHFAGFLVWEHLDASEHLHSYPIEDLGLEGQYYIEIGEALAG